MGNSGSQAVTSAAAASALKDQRKKEKKRCKRIACCCVWCNIGAIVSVIIGIVLLVYFSSSLGDNYSRTRPGKEVAKAVSYTGIAFLILGVLLVLVGIGFVLLLVVTYRKLSGKSSSKPFTPKIYAEGTAPYPQQDWGNQPNPHHPEASPIPPAQPPSQPAGSPGVDPTQIVPEIR